MPLRLKLRFHIALHALWLTQAEFEKLSASEIRQQLLAVLNEEIATVGGIEALASSITWQEKIRPSLSDELHSKIETALAEHATLAEAAKSLGVDRSTLYRWVQRSDIQTRPRLKPRGGA